MEMIQDLLAPEKENIPIVEDPKMRDVLVPGASVVEIKDHKSITELLKAGEANRAIANTRLNAESSRSHAILVVRVAYDYVNLVSTSKLGYKKSHCLESRSI